MKVTPTRLPEVLLVEPAIHRDDRGWFVETWNRARYQGMGLCHDTAQDNMSWSKRGVLRGLHLQHPHGQGKLVYALVGHIFDVAVDVRVDSPRFGQWVGVELSQDNMRQLYIPEGFAHGFCVLSSKALVAYKCTEAYHREYEIGLRWNDPRINIQWPLANPILSEKDGSLPTLSELNLDRLPRLIDDAPACVRAA